MLLKQPASLRKIRNTLIYIYINILLCTWNQETVSFFQHCFIENIKMFTKKIFCNVYLSVWLSLLKPHISLVCVQLYRHIIQQHIFLCVSVIPQSYNIVQEHNKNTNKTNKKITLNIQAGYMLLFWVCVHNCFLIFPFCWTSRRRLKHDR